MVTAMTAEELDEVEKRQLAEEERFHNLWDEVLDTEQEQLDFEDWICQNWDEEHHNFEKFDTGAYTDPDVEYTWHGWIEGRIDLFIKLERMGLIKYE